MSSPATSGSDLRAKAAAYLDALCLPYPDRHVGGPGNADSNAMFAAAVAKFGWEVEATEFPCVVWEPGAASIDVGNESWGLNPGPYSPAVDVSAPIVSAATIDELESMTAQGSVLVLRGALVREQLTPKNYPFYQWESHTRIITAIERVAPAAVIAATGRSSELVGSLYPFPLIEDADFDVPHAYLTDVEGEGLIEHVGQVARLAIGSARHRATAEQVVARRGPSDRRIVVSGHIDSRLGSPGAVDNASGVVSLLLIAELLADFNGSIGLELVPFNGEDDYAAPGEVSYLVERAERLRDEVMLNINIDGVGWREHVAEVSFYECPDDLADLARGALAADGLVVEGDAWPQSDHMIFVMRGIPAIALTTADAAQLRWHVAHTAADKPSVVDPAVIVEVASYVADVIRAIAGR